jgi:hypothetical protein
LLAAGEIQMNDDHWKAMYEQLNLRSRWYTTQLWAIPFAYVGLAGLGLDKIPKWTYPWNSLGFGFLALLSFGVFVHISSLLFITDSVDELKSS